MAPIQSHRLRTGHCAHSASLSTDEDRTFNSYLLIKMATALASSSVPAHGHED